MHFRVYLIGFGDVYVSTEWAYHNVCHTIGIIQMRPMCIIMIMVSQMGSRCYNCQI
jgi:hypothetical protein